MNFGIRTLMKILTILLLLTLSYAQNACAIVEIDEPAHEEDGQIQSSRPSVVYPPPEKTPPQRSSVSPIRRLDSAIECKARQPNPQPNAIFSWTGGCKEGYLSGDGLFQWIVNGNPESKYEGSMETGKYHGKGVKTGTSKSGISYRYEGDFNDGEYHGYGLMSWGNGSRYEGYFVNGQRSGRGKYFWPDGVSYEGDWVNGQRVGKGIKTGTSKSGISYRYEGDFVDGEYHGFGLMSWGNGDRYEGDFIKGQRSGKGVYRFADGRILKGRFQNGKYLGE